MHRLSHRAVLGALVALFASRAQAQSRYVLSPFASHQQLADRIPTLVGAELTTYGGRLGGILGMRFGGAYDIRALTSSSADSDTERGWVVDADAVISPARLPVIGPLLGGFLPTRVLRHRRGRSSAQRRHGRPERRRRAMAWA